MSGRPPKYSDYELKDILMKIALNYKEKITPSLLEKRTNIKRHVWLRRMRKEIDLVNKGTTFIDKDSINNLPLPNIANIVEKYYEDKEKLINELIWYNEKLQDAYNKISENESLKSKIIDIENKLKNKDLRIKELEQKCKYFEELYLVSEAKNNMFNGISALESNGKIIDLEKEKQKLSLIDFENQFPDLFDLKNK
ncbi:TPA: hypothetical protein ACXDAY_002490 [Clostridium botulinum]|uniref:hypothetical protein n=2 Tax=Clostridium botulinum TaxID=1491 RepID=UPI00035BA605|nr:hypothetical protein [Clostridium botulinum]APQ73407.1 hypothetical protein RSJ9_2302 [Clostridium botulinum]APQ95569.1 hypothetical protein RSJ3_2020 [Clostridium botulinum]EPS56245.1 hypothetical protein CLQ_12138 [Clostridium botulinum Af84]MBN3350520.1 hypothetical protein [Clostridium botulinum]MBN3357556.1 hypothetical protein [Clostridium botulinum]